MLSSVLYQYGLPGDSIKVESFGSGLINNTWKITTAGGEYILQRINGAVFKRPSDIADNINLIAEHLREFYPEYKFVAPVRSIAGDEIVYKEKEGFFRLFPFVSSSHSKNVVATSDQAYEAAVQFGRFTRLLSSFDVSKLKVTIPSFHDVTVRHRQFVAAQKNGNKERMGEAKKMIDVLTGYENVVKEFEYIKSHPGFKLRVTHHDTKISNVLFDENEKAVCVIDLDTVMPGYFLSDVGDMMRTYLSPVTEEEKDYGKISIRVDFYKAIVRGYFSEMKDELTATEKKYFFYAGKLMIYMQAIRFLTDYLNNDEYYKPEYPGHNLVRAGNQLVLLERFSEKESLLAGFTG